MRSAVVVVVPEAAPIVDELRLRHTHDAPLGMPAHVTVLFPFVPTARLDEAEEALGPLLREHPAFDATFAQTARFPGVLYLAPDPAERFSTLTHAVAAAWPEHPPYEGAHDTVIPHLTVGESDDDAVLDALAAEVEPQLPVRARVDAVSLFAEDVDGRWHAHRGVPLGRSGQGVA